MNLKLNFFCTFRKMTLAMRRFAKEHGFLNIFVPVYEFFRKPIYGFLKPQGRVKIRAAGFNFYVSGDDYVVASDLMTYGYWEKEETEIVKRSLKPGMTFIDIGANFGYFSMLAARLVGPQGRVYAFEPEPGNYDLLCRNIKGNGFKEIVFPFPYAISKEVGTLEFFLSAQNHGAHSLGQGNVRLGTSGSVKVQAVALDDFLESQSVKSVDFIKSDTQGAEAWIFEGAQKILRNNPHLTLLIEFWPLGIQNLGGNPEVFLNSLIKEGFKINFLEEAALTAANNLKEIIKTADRHTYVTLLLEK